MIVYKITNSINGKVYFGVTKCALEKRWREHKSKSRSGKTQLSYSMRKYGIDNFSIEIIKACSNEDEMYALEVLLIKEHNSNNPKYGYNLSSGGEHSSLGKKLTEEHKRKISNYQKTRKRQPHSEQTRGKMSIAGKGRDMSAAIKASSENRRGVMPNNAKAVILNGNEIFRSMSDASKEKKVSIGAIHNNIKGLSKKTKIGVWKPYEHKI